MGHHIIIIVVQCSAIPYGNVATYYSASKLCCHVMLHIVISVYYLLVDNYVYFVIFIFIYVCYHYVVKKDEYILKEIQHYTV